MSPTALFIAGAASFGVLHVIVAGNQKNEPKAVSAQVFVAWIGIVQLVGTLMWGLGPPALQWLGAVMWLSLPVLGLPEAIRVLGARGEHAENADAGQRRRQLHVLPRQGRDLQAKVTRSRRISRAAAMLAEDDEPTGVHHRVG